MAHDQQALGACALEHIANQLSTSQWLIIFDDVWELKDLDKLGCYSSELRSSILVTRREASEWTSFALTVGLKRYTYDKQALAILASNVHHSAGEESLPESVTAEVQVRLAPDSSCSTF
jgi:NB-ARC domain